jgi:cell division protein FtsI (penicillin-binding protein 3)
VIVKNKPHAAIYYGGAIAGPVFKEIADRLYSTYIKQSNTNTAAARKPDSSIYRYAGSKQDMLMLSSKLALRYTDSTMRADEWVDMNGKNATIGWSKRAVTDNMMPQLKGMGLKDAVYLCESMGLKITVKGKGKVSDQSIIAGQPIAKGQLVSVALN